MWYEDKSLYFYISQYFVYAFISLCVCLKLKLEFFFRGGRNKTSLFDSLVDSVQFIINSLSRLSRFGYA